MTANPDVVIKLQPDYCNTCGAPLQEMPAIKKNSRQVVDIPPIKAVYTEYQTFSKVCNCGFQTTAAFPQRVKTPVSYGENIESLIAYFHARQYIPFARIKEIFNTIFGVNISEGGLHYLLEKFAQKTTPIYEIIKNGFSKAL